MAVKFCRGARKNTVNNFELGAMELIPFLAVRVHSI